ncbi:MAG: glycosyltransferase family 4 protein [Chitinophagaceae bacterium]
MRILWLCSWYPNEKDAYRGDFIQRQAIATSAYCSIDVVHVVFWHINKHTQHIQNNNLKEYIFYVQEKNAISNFRMLKKILHQFLLDKKYDAIHLHIPFPVGSIAVSLSKKYNIPLYVSEHYGIYQKGVDGSYYNRSFLYKNIIKKTIRHAKKLIVVSQSLGQDMQQAVAAKDYHVISNVVDTKHFYHASQTKNAIFQFIHVSGMDANKNVEGIIKACALLKYRGYKFHMRCIGAKPQALLQLSKELQVDKDYISFDDAMTYVHVAQQVHKAHVGILFSYSETQSCVILEWLCSGLPVITSAVGGAKELINKDNGLLVQAGHVEDLVQAMESIMINYNQYDTKNIALQAQEKYSYEQVGKQIVTCYL